MFGKRNHTRHKISEKVASTATSWLDLYPAIPAVHKPSNTYSKLVARLKALKETLENDIKPNMEIRTYFLQLYKSGAKVCFSCSDTDGTATACGPTCSLFSPFYPLVTVPCMRTDWYQHASVSVKTYHRIVEQMKEKGENATDSRIEKWEKDVKILRKDVLNWSELREENGWTKVADYARAMTVVDMNWTFEGAWGTQRTPDEEVAPDEV